MHNHFQSIFDDNLIIPDLVGKIARFQNLREYILYFNTSVNKQFIDMEKLVFSEIEKESSKSKLSTKEEIGKIKQQFQSNLDNNQKQIKEEFQIGREEDKSKVDQINIKIKDLDRRLNL